MGDCNRGGSGGLRKPPFGGSGATDQHAQPRERERVLMSPARLSRRVPPGGGSTAERRDRIGPGRAPAGMDARPATSQYLQSERPSERQPAGLSASRAVKPSSVTLSGGSGGQQAPRLGREPGDRPDKHSPGAQPQGGPGGIQGGGATSGSPAGGPEPGRPLIAVRSRRRAAGGGGPLPRQPLLRGTGYSERQGGPDR